VVAVRVARAALSPTLKLGASFTRNSEAQQIAFPVPGTGRLQSFKVGSANVLDVRTEALYTLTSGGRDPALVRAAEAAESARRHDRDQAESDLTLRVSQEFYRALAARRLEAAATDALTSARAHRSVSAARVRAGVVARLDSLQAQVDVAQRANALVRAQEAVRVSRVELESTIGAPLDTSRSLVEPGRPGALDADPAAAVDRALQARPELASLDESLRENASKLEAARDARHPQLNLSATAEYLGPNLEEQWWNTDVPGLRTYKLYTTLGLSMPLYDAGLVRARAGEVAADRAGLAARREDQALTVRREVEQAVSDVQVAYTLWQSDSSRVAAAGEALRIAEAGYKGGTVTGADVRAAEAGLADARAEEAQSLMDYWTARASLQHATGGREE
jgi:outer membrane protein TolC